MNRGRNGRSGTFVSPAMPIGASGDINVIVTHGLGRPPISITWKWVCLSAEIGYSPGDRKPLGTNNSTGGLTEAWENDNQAGVLLDSAYAGSIQFAHKTTCALATMTRTKWALQCIVF